MAKIVMVKGKPVLRDDWHEEDIHSVADCMDLELTDKQVLEVMQLVAKSRDCNNGINWEVIESAIDAVMESA